VKRVLTGEKVKVFPGKKGMTNRIKDQVYISSTPTEYWADCLIETDIAR